MAIVRSRAQLPVGSAPWIHDENDQVNQFCGQEIEDFTFSARNEVEWLNEHMADIFSKNQVNVTEIFKTPGKLRGKTPRTARKRNPLEIREPLTDVFSANARTNGSPLHRSSPFKPIPMFQVAEDPVAPAAAKKLPKTNTDSGYHGMSEEDIDVEQEPALVPSSAADTHDTVEDFPPSSAGVEPNTASQSEDRSTTEPSFHSAKEEFTKRDVTIVSPQREAKPIVDAETQAEPTKDNPVDQITSNADQPQQDAMDLEMEDKDLDEDLIVDESRTPSQGSSPARPLVRKSSLTFAALPAREPLTTKKSIGARISRTSHIDQSKGAASRGSYLERFTGGKSLGGFKQPESGQDADRDDQMDIDVERPELVREESEDSRMTKLHNKSSTQRLHERINMLGKSQPARPTKSIPAVAATANLSYPELPSMESQPQNLQHTASLALKTVNTQSDEEDDDDWIQPPQSLPTLSDRPQLLKSVSTDVMEDIRGKQTISGQDFDIDQKNREPTNEGSPVHQAKARGPDRPSLVRAASASKSESSPGTQVPANVESTQDTSLPGVSRAQVAASSTTPIGSPSSKRYVDGPLSASKSKLQSIMKTARGLFSSSAGVSAQAKMETLSPSMHTREDVEGRVIGSSLQSKSAKSRKSNSPPDNPLGRKTRSSTEKEERRKVSEAKERQQAALEAEWHQQISAETKEISKSIRQSPRKAPHQEAPRDHQEAAESDIPSQPMGPPPPHAQGQSSQAPRPKEARRPVRPAKEAAPKPKPQPVAIRVGTLSQGLRMNNTALSSSLQDSLPSQQKQPAVAKKPSNASIHSAASTGSFKSSITSATTKPKALIAAERKKEQDEKEAQRKLDQKREIERKRAAQQEEARQQLQRQEAERQRERERSAAAEDPKNIAKRQAIEKRRLEMQKKDQPRAPQRPGAEHTQTATTRPELGGSRPVSRLQNVPDHSRTFNNHPMQNPVKPPGIKRVFDPDADDEPLRPARPQGGPSYQMNEAKRRKTEDEDLQEVRIRPTMAPPIRQSGIRPGGPKASIFNNSYAPAPPSASHHHNAPTLLKSTTANQAYQQHAPPNQISRPGHHPDIAKYQNGKIPFADAPNPPAPSKTP
ncbi:hypothetical protein P7C71_g6329, partial [Lecanoromycetidae sp. Uapishka_2]